MAVPTQALPTPGPVPALQPAPPPALPATGVVTPPSRPGMAPTPPSRPGMAPTPPSRPGMAPLPHFEDFVGRSFHGYRIEAKIGEGGMGAVFRATQVALKRTVALKILPPRLSQDDACTERFRREAQALARLDHSAIVPVYDMFRIDGLFCIAMGFCGGGSVRDLLKREGRIDERRAAGLVYHAAQGLWAAAQADIVHRDIKPDNILLTDTGKVRIADFGLVKAQPKSDESSRRGLTTAGELLGTPAYMSPEQLRGSARTDHRSDLYSLGCTLCELLTGKPPYVGKSTVHVVEQHLLEEPPDLRAVGVDPALAAVVRRLLAKDPDARFQTGAELAAALDRFVDDPREQSGSDAHAFDGPPPPPLAPPPAPPPPPTADWRRASEPPPALPAPSYAALPPRSAEVPVASAGKTARGSCLLLGAALLVLALGAVCLFQPEASRALYERAAALLAGDPDPAARCARAAFAAEAGARRWQRLVVLHGSEAGEPVREAEAALRRGRRLHSERRHAEAEEAYAAATRAWESACAEAQRLMNSTR